MCHLQRAAAQALDETLCYQIKLRSEKVYTKNGHPIGSPVLACSAPELLSMIHLLVISPQCPFWLCDLTALLCITSTIHRGLLPCHYTTLQALLTSAHQNNSSARWDLLQRPYRCAFEGCNRHFTRKEHLMYGWGGDCTASERL
jgi:hypothetical protein